MPSCSTTDSVRALVRRFGWNATAFQVLEPGYQYLFVGADACVAYVDTGTAWVAAGAPLADEGRFAEVTAAFVAAARQARRRACLFATEERFVSRVALRRLAIGEQPIWDPALWPETLKRNRRLREQLRRARAKEVQVRAIPAAELLAPSSATHAEIAALVSQWLRARELAPMGFLVQAEPLTFLPEQRVFVAAHQGTLVGLLAMSPIYARGGWLLQRLVRAEGAPNGTVEALIDQAMRAAASDGARLVTLGLAPLAGRVAAPLRFARRAGRALFDFEGLRSFKAKLRPTHWDRVYLSFPPGQSAARSVADVLTAFARGGLLRFGLRTLLRGPAILVYLLAVLLIPWTALLACADTEIWFPHPAVKWFWVAFDIGLAAALYVLQRRWYDRLALIVAIAIGADAVSTMVEAWVWNLPRAATLGARLVLIVATAAPAIAFGVLWRARLRRRE